MLVQTSYLAPSDPTLPAMALQITQLVDSYMVWVGVTDEPPEEVNNAPLHGSLSRDWACAMPPITASAPGGCTSIFRSSGSDAALSMAQRLARRFKKQVFLSVDVPPTFTGMVHSAQVLLDVEKRVVATLKELEA